ncbi:MAG: ATP synthase F1 subunit epsilon [Planctomycetes bacterium]|nr:ATP synthase F1 subunit epsilon [Planctomycetota bacterium]
MADVHSASGKQIHLTVITPARTVFNEDAAGLVVPAFDGELGVLPGHAALMALLGAGELRITRADGSKKRLAVRGGFLQVSANVVTVLTPESVAAEDIDAAKLDKELEALRADQSTDLKARDLRDEKLKWAVTRRHILEAGKGAGRN